MTETRSKPGAARALAHGVAAALSALLATTIAVADDHAPPIIERVTTIAPYPRGLAVVDGDLYVLCRGRVRGGDASGGGVSAVIDDQAGTIYVVDPNVGEPIDRDEVGAAVRRNGVVFARPTEPPFRLWDRSSDPPESDRHTDRPYCTLRHDPATESFYLCAFSGVDLPQTATDAIAFSKNRSDAILRYDLRTRRWYEVERKRSSAGARSPHVEPVRDRPPHGWLDGPDNCLPLGSWLYAVAKDNSRLVRYDLSALRRDPDAGCPPGEVVLGETVIMEDGAERIATGQSALAFRDGWLYVGYRTTSEIIRIPLDANFDPVTPIRGQIVARFDPYDPSTGRSANITDMAFDDAGRLYVISASPARIFRFTPDASRPLDARRGRTAPWIDLAARTGHPRMKSENLLAHSGWLYVTSGDGYAYQDGAHGTVYRIRIED